MRTGTELGPRPPRGWSSRTRCSREKQTNLTLTLTLYGKRGDGAPLQRQRDREWFQGLEKGRGEGPAHGDGVSTGARENARFGAISQACTGVLRPLRNP